MTRYSQNKGQSLVEVALLLPVLLLLLAGGYVCCRSAFLVSAAETAARTEALRSGRRQPGIEKMMSDSIMAGGDGITIRPEDSDRSRLLPSPFPSMTGRTKGIVEIRKPWTEAGFASNLPELQAVRAVEASVDCWDKGSASGKKVNGFVRGIVATGILR